MDNRIKYIIQILLFITIITASVILLFPIQRKLDSAVEELKKESINYIESLFDRSISYRSISPSIFLALELRGVTIGNEIEDDLLYIQCVRISYSLLNLIRGNIIDAVKEISIVNSSFFLDTERDRELIDFFLSLIDTDRAADTDIPAVKFSGKNLDIVINDPKGSIALDNFFFSFTAKNRYSNSKKRLADFTAQGDISLDNINNLNNLSSGNLSFSCNGNIDLDILLINGNVTLKHVNTNLFSMKNSRVDFSLQPEGFRLRKKEDHFPFDIDLEYLFDDKIASISFEAEAFRPESFFSTKNELAFMSPWLSTVISAYGLVQIDLNRNEYNHTIRGQFLADNQHTPTALSIDINAAGNNDQLYFHKLFVKSALGNITFAGNIDTKTRFPQGKLEVENVQIGDYTISTITDIESKNQALHFYSDMIAINELELKEFDLITSMYAQDIDFSTSFIVNNQNETDENYFGSIVADGNIDISPQPFIQVSLQSQDTPILPLLGLLSHPEIEAYENNFTKGLTVSSSLFFSTDLERFSFSASEVKLINREHDTSFIFSAVGNERSINLSNISLSYQDIVVRGETEIEIDSAHSTLAFYSSFETRQIDYSFYGTIDSNGNLTVQGDYDFFAAMNFSGEHIDLSLDTIKFPFPIRDTIMEITLRASGFYKDSQNWSFNFYSTYITDIPLPINDNALLFSGSVTPQSISFYSLDYQDALSTISGYGAFNYKIQSFPEIQGWLHLQNSDLSEQYDINITIKKDNTLQAGIVFQKALLERIPGIPLSGKASGMIDVYGSITNPNIHAIIELPEAHLLETPFSMDTEVTLIDGKADIHSLNLTYGTHQARGVQGGYNLTQGTFTLSGDYKWQSAVFPVSNSLLITGLTEPMDSHKDLPLLANNNFHSTVQVSTMELKYDSIPNFSMDITREDSYLSFQGGVNQSISGYYSLNDGELTATLDTPFPIVATVSGMIFENNIDLSLKNIIGDLSVLKYAPIPFYNITQGTATGDLDIRGEIKDPDFYGTLEMSNIHSNLEGFIKDDITPFPGTIAFHDKDFRVEPQIVTVGRSTVLVNADFIMDEWIPQTFYISLETKGNRGLAVLYELSEYGLEVDGLATGYLTIFGDMQNQEIIGDLTVSNCVITIGEQQAPSPSSIDYRSATIDLTFTSGRRIEFLWPTRTLPILRAFPATGQTLSVRYDGPTDSYNVRGDVNIRGGEVYYFQRNFYLTEGAIYFDEDQNEFDPSLSIRAQLREIDATGNIVRVSLIVDERPFSQFSPRFESDPPMSDVEIASLLGSGFFGQDGRDVGLESAFAITGDFISQFGIMRAFEQQVKDIFNLDLFSIRTQMIQTVLFDRLVPGETVQLDHNTTAMGRYLDNTTLFLGKYFGNDLFFQAMINMQASSIIAENDAILPKKEGKKEGIIVDAELGFEWDTPLFLLNFSVQPDFDNSLNTIRSINLGFSWGYSF